MVVPVRDRAVDPMAGDLRPKLGFRVGITGHRTLGQADAAKLDTVLGAILDDVARTFTKFAQNDMVESLYAGSQALLRFVSPLAEGADRIGARLAIDRGWRLTAPLPFPQAIYEDDFPGSVAEFRALLDVARRDNQIVELDGTRKDVELAYRTVGHFVLRNSDLLIAIWDGADARGIGGTARIVEAARGYGIPVVHVDAAAPHAARLLVGTGEEPRAYSPAVLVELIEHVVVPSFSAHARRGALSYLKHERARWSTDRACFVYRGPFGLPWTIVGSVFPAMIRTFGRQASNGTTAATSLVEPPNAPDPTLVLHYQRADMLAVNYAQVHRSVFVLIYLVGAFALSTAVAALFFVIARPSFTLFEGVLLFLIFAFVICDRWRRWRERWLDYRLLAELLREADLLAHIGRSLPHHILADLAIEHENRAWVPWLAAALSRATPVVGARYDHAYLERLRNYAAVVRLADQIGYHDIAQRRNQLLNKRLRILSEVLFFATLAMVLLELLVPDYAKYLLAAFWAACFPALATASFGIRNQAEFEIVGRRSQRMRARLVRQRERIASLVGPRLSSEVLGREILRAAEIMVSDAAEWASIFDVKETETA